MRGFNGISGAAMSAAIAASAAMREAFLAPLRGPNPFQFGLPGPRETSPEPRRRRSSRYYAAHSGQQERMRRVRQDAAWQQQQSHKPGTVQPRHIFGSWRDDGTTYNRSET